ncbi:hypothetical protein RchiOBHm_Chr2g0087321 [Rosa chinensis]|uniref:Uncharacterized protein n=1 Tax=Rosa chinensis TaxID=74649 RepID=A0A2P6RIN0_ROSCH|nr:hypothetical protein RchiOBHm_Chr2g0087321 [Rosa chinensis]
MLWNFSVFLRIFWPSDADANFWLECSERKIRILDKVGVWNLVGASLASEDLVLVGWSWGAFYAREEKERVLGNCIIMVIIKLHM